MALSCHGNLASRYSVAAELGMPGVQFRHPWRGFRHPKPDRLLGFWGDQPATRVTACFATQAGGTLHGRKSITPDAETAAIYTALGLSPKPGGISQRMFRPDRDPWRPWSATRRVFASQRID